MAESKMTLFAKAIRKGDRDKARGLVEEVLKEKEMGEYGPSTDLKELPGIGSEEASEIEMYGYNSIEKLGSTSIEKLVKIPCLSGGKASDAQDSAREYLKDRLRSLPGAGSDRVEKLWEKGYYSLEDLAQSSIDDLVKVPKIGKKSAEKIVDSAKKKLKEEIEGLPGTGPDRAELLMDNGFISIEKLASADQSDLENLPKIGSKSSEDIIDAAQESFKEIFSSVLEPSVSDEVWEYGYDSIESIAKASLEDLVLVPGLREGKAEETLEFARKYLEESGKGIGYKQALNGVIVALDSDHELTLPQKIAEEKYSRDELEEIRDEMDTRADQDFRPEDEKGFSQAWADILEALLDLEQ